MNILHVLCQQLHMEVNCVLLSTYTFIHLYMIFMPFYINDSTARVTHFSSTLIFRLDILTMDCFFTSFYLMMILQNNPLVPTSGREFFAFCSIHPGDVRSNTPYTIPQLPLVLHGS